MKKRAPNATPLPPLASTRFAGSADRFVALAAAAQHLRASNVEPARWPRIYRRASETAGTTPTLATATQHRQYMDLLEAGQPLPTADHPGDIGDQIVRAYKHLPPEPIELYVLEDELRALLGRKHVSRGKPWHDALAIIANEAPRIAAKDAHAKLEAAGHTMTIVAVQDRLSKLRR